MEDDMKCSLHVLLMCPLLSLASCTNSFTREDLGNLNKEVIVIWTVDGSHYHIRQWTIDDQGNVNGVGLTCTSKSTRFDHPYENVTDFSGTIQKSSIVTVRTSSTHTSSSAVIWVAVFGVIFAIAAASTFKVGGIM